MPIITFTMRAAPPHRRRQIGDGLEERTSHRQRNGARAAADALSLALVGNVY